MKILYVGPKDDIVMDFIASFGDEVTNTELPLDNDSSVLLAFDLIVSYKYRHIIKPEIINTFLHRIINLHISLLPWNRGADPNLWSFLEDSPKGVSIHYIDSGVDTGDIIAQKEVDSLPDDTLKTSYDRLSVAIVELFKEFWPDIRSGKNKSWPQPLGGTFHKSKDKQRYENLLTNGWDTPVKKLIGAALKK
jgi:methionyl-tRNA formyltransferase